MKKIVLFLMIVFSVSLFATDVSNFDFKGIKLGMSKDKVIKKMQKISSYSLEKTTPIYVGDKITGYQLVYSGENDEDFTFNFDKNQKLYEFWREIQLKKIANINKIFNQIYAKYGQPEDIWDHLGLFQVSYGECERGEYYFKPIKNKKCFHISLFKSDNTLNFMITDDSIYRINQKYQNTLKRKLYNKERQKASRIDL